MSEFPDDFKELIRRQRADQEDAIRRHDAAQQDKQQQLESINVKLLALFETARGLSVAALQKRSPLREDITIYRRSRNPSRLGQFLGKETIDAPEAQGWMVVSASFGQGVYNRGKRSGPPCWEP
jgi:hypothetical protein